MVETSRNTPRLLLRRWVRVVLASSVLGLAGCASVIDVAEMEYFDDGLKAKKEKIFKVETSQQCDKTLQRMQEIQNYIISVDSEGRYEPVTQKLHAEACDKLIEVKQPVEFDKHAKNIIESIRAAKDGRKNILIYIHGGLNTPSFSRNRAIEQSFIISRYQDKKDEKNGTRQYYPIFINWNSGLTSSYMEKILFVRQGRRISGIQAYLTAPLNLVSDMAQAIARIPSTWEKSTSRFVQTKFFDKLEECDEIKKNKTQYKIEASLVCDGKLRDSFAEADRTFRFIASWPFRLLGSPLVDAFGETAWISMLRRTRLIFRTPEEFENFEIHADTNRFNGLADVSSFLRMLEDEVSKNGNSEGYSITLISHSMGAIIANDIIRYFPKLPYKNIVYMAAASSISHVQETVVPLLSRPGNKVRFYNLMLHPDAESREYTLKGIGPTGSLLEWIDEYYTNPATLTDRRFGNWRNLFYTRRMMPKEARNHMTFKVFGFTRKLNNPMRHGDFSGTDQCYWRPEFWRTQVYRGKSNTFCRYAVWAASSN